MRPRDRCGPSDCRPGPTQRPAGCIAGWFAGHGRLAGLATATLATTPRHPDPLPGFLTESDPLGRCAHLPHPRPNVRRGLGHVFGNYSCWKLFIVQRQDFVSSVCNWCCQVCYRIGLLCHDLGGGLVEPPPPQSPTLANLACTPATSAPLVAPWLWPTWGTLVHGWRRCCPVPAVLCSRAVCQAPMPAQMYQVDGHIRSTTAQHATKHHAAALPDR